MARSRTAMPPIGARTEIRYAISSPGSMIIDRSLEIDDYDDDEEDVSGSETLEAEARTSDKHRRINVSSIDTHHAGRLQTPLSRECNLSEALKTESPGTQPVQGVGRARRRLRASRVSKILPVIPRASTTMRLLQQTRQKDIRKVIYAQESAQAVQREHIMAEWKSSGNTGDQDYLQVLEARRPARGPADGSLDRRKTPYQRVCDARTISSRKDNWKVHDGKRRDDNGEGEKGNQACSTDPPTLTNGET